MPEQGEITYLNVGDVFPSRQGPLREERIDFELLDVIQTDVHPISLIKFWADHVI